MHALHTCCLHACRLATWTSARFLPFPVLTLPPLCSEWVDITKAKSIATKLVNFLMTGHPDGHETEEGECNMHARAGRRERDVWQMLLVAALATPACSAWCAVCHASCIMSRPSCVSCMMSRSSAAAVPVALPCAPACRASHMPGHAQPFARTFQHWLRRFPMLLLSRAPFCCEHCAARAGGLSKEAIKELLKDYCDDAVRAFVDDKLKLRFQVCSPAPPTLFCQNNAEPVRPLAPAWRAWSAAYVVVTSACLVLEVEMVR